MTIKEFLDGIPENYVNKSGKSLKDEMIETADIWDNNTCKGYCIIALERAGYNAEQVRAVLSKLNGAFSDFTTSEAEQKYVEYFYS